MSAVVKGVAPDAPTATNAAGGKQSASPYRCDLLPPLASLAVAEVLAHGAEKYGANNWHKIPVEDHLNHALAHIFADRAGDTQDSHLEHAACRIFMALEQKLAGRPKPNDEKAEPREIRESEMKPGVLYQAVRYGWVKEIGPIKDWPSPFIRWKLVNSNTAYAALFRVP